MTIKGGVRRMKVIFGMVVESSGLPPIATGQDLAKRKYCGQDSPFQAESMPCGIAARVLTVVLLLTIAPGFRRPE